MGTVYGHCTGTVRALYGHCTGTVKTLHYCFNPPIASSVNHSSLPKLSSIIGSSLFIPSSSIHTKTLAVHFHPFGGPFGTSILGTRVYQRQRALVLWRSTLLVSGSLSSSQRLLGSHDWFAQRSPSLPAYLLM